MTLTLEELTRSNYQYACEIDRDDIPETFVDTVDTLMEITEYGVENHCIGHTFLVKADEQYIGLLLLGEAVPWDTDPEEMRKEPFYRLMGFVRVYEDFGKRPIALGCHKDNFRAARFYERHGFKKTGVFEGNDEYFLRLL